MRLPILQKDGMLVMLEKKSGIASWTKLASSAFVILALLRFFFLASKPSTAVYILESASSLYGVSLYQFEVRSSTAAPYFSVTLIHRAIPSIPPRSSRLGPEMQRLPDSLYRAPSF